MSNHLSTIYKQILELSCQQQLKTGSRVYSQVFLFATFPGKMLSCIGDRKEARSRRSRQSLELLLAAIVAMLSFLELFCSVLGSKACCSPCGGFALIRCLYVCMSAWTRAPEVDALLFLDRFFSFSVVLRARAGRQNRSWQCHQSHSIETHRSHNHV